MREITEKAKTLFFVFLSTMFILLAFVFNTPSEIWTGFLKILVSPSKLLTDYIQLTNIGATFINVGLMILFSVAVIKLNHGNINGNLISAIFTVAGFSFFGKNLFNSIIITFGVYLYSKIKGKPFKEYLLPALFGTALGPLVSELSFGLDKPIWLGVLLGITSGIFSGLIIPPLAMSFSKFHYGFNLYNVGFTTGIIGMFFMAILRSMGIEVEPVSITSSGNNLCFLTILYLLFILVLIFGLYVNGWSFKGYTKMLKLSGRSGLDFTKVSGFGLTMINIALLGVLSTSYVLIIGGEINGPTIGGILTVAGFGASGKHIKNVIPIIVGVLFAKLLNIYDYNSTAAILAALFGTTLAPIAGHYGFIYGIMVGFIHMGMTMNVGLLHGGLNLYNNGFSGGFIAAAVVPILDSFIARKLEYDLTS